MQRRSDTVHKLAASTYDVCVIGGGASGAGCALDAQLRGLRTLLIEANDFGSATSSASTKLIHGGLRYLQQAVMEFDAAQYRVVRLALHERRLMMDNAPHLTRASQFAVPCFTLAQALYYLVGLKIYDRISGHASLAPSHFTGRAKSLRFLPWLNSNRLFGTVYYSDGQFDDARYNLALIQSCAEAGGDVLNYARLVNFEKNGRGALVAASVQDEESGETFRITARAFVNATGPFSDRIRSLANPAARSRLRPSKGVHILLPLPDGFGENAFLIPATEDGRVIFAIPWYDRLLVGTTELECGPDTEMVVTAAEADYLLRHLNRYLVRAFEARQIVSAMAGLRPLIQSADPRDTSKLIRDYEVELDPASGLISILGGKWTVYRAMAEDTIDAVENMLKGRATSCGTRTFPLFAAGESVDALTRQLADGYPAAAQSIRHLVQKFGNCAREVLELTKQEPSLAALLAAGAPQIRAEVVYCARHEMAVRVEDVLCRRTGLQFFDWRLALQAAPVVADLLGRELGWPQSRTREEVQRYTKQVERLRSEFAVHPVDEVSARQ